MKLPYSIKNGDYSHCRVHGYLNSNKFYPSDLKVRRRSCRVCTKKRVDRSKKSPAEVVLSRFKQYARRHGHYNETRLWEPADIEYVLCNSNNTGDSTAARDVVLRPMYFDAEVWEPAHLYTISVAESRKKKRFGGRVHVQLPATSPTSVTEEFVYSNVLPTLENAGVFLTAHGNINSGCHGPLEGELLEDYLQQKQQKTLFNLDQVIDAMVTIPAALCKCSDVHTSYALKHIVERASGAYKPNGAVVLALLLSGHKARIRGDSSEGILLNPMFLLSQK